MPSPEQAPAQTDGEDALALVGLVVETASGMRRLTGARWERRYGLPTQSFDVLVRLARAPGGRLRMSELATRTALTPSGLTRAVDRLCSAGLVARESCDEDRRGAFARLTPEGAETMREALEYHRRHVDELLDSALTRSEREALVDLLRRLRDGLACPGV
ncbi:MAG TPA: MarR family transcriptional regulator [Acidimicrobiales bacterium]|nr:MarR family transcriptional regulator [Acidimicrobiales bacterium]